MLFLQIREYTFCMAASIEEVRKFLERKDRKSKKKNNELFINASMDFDKILRHIILNYSEVRVYQWGSLLNRDDFDMNSDIDIAVEGLPSAQAYFKLSRELSRMTSFPLDFIELDKINPIDRDSILKKGKIVYAPK